MYTVPSRRGESGDTLSALAAFRAGDGEGLPTLLAAFGNMMRAVARRYVRGHDVDDAVQDAWVAFTASASAIRDPAALGGWLRTTTANAAMQDRQAPSADGADRTLDGRCPRLRRGGSRLRRR